MSFFKKIFKKQNTPLLQGKQNNDSSTHPFSPFVNEFQEVLDQAIVERQKAIDDNLSFLNLVVEEIFPSFLNCCKFDFREAVYQGKPSFRVRFNDLLKSSNLIKEKEETERILSYRSDDPFYTKFNSHFFISHNVNPMDYIGGKICQKLGFGRVEDNFIVISVCELKQVLSNKSDIGN